MTFTRSFIRATGILLVKFFEEEIIFKFDTPEVVICVNGTQLIGKVFTDMLNKYAIRYENTPRYYPQANPVESTNKTIKTMIKAEIIARHEAHEDWAKHLPLITMNLNDTPHSSTGYSPHFIVFGRERCTTGNEHRIILDANPDEDSSRERRECIHDDVEEALRTAFEEGRKRYDLRATHRKFKLGDEVYLKNRKLSNAGEKYMQKLGAKIKARITKAIGTDTYQLAHAHTGEDLGVYNARDIYTR